MRIILTPDVFLRLSMIDEIVGGREFSGYGFIDVVRKSSDAEFHVYDIELLDVGTTGYTEFSSQDILGVLGRSDAPNMKLWFHKHPLGNGKPGPHNWSGTDNDTCVNEPLGCPDPDRVGWALAMVLTPGGWVGRIDKYKDGKCVTRHIPVELMMNWKAIDKAHQLLTRQKNSEGDRISARSDYYAKRGKYGDDYDSAHAALDVCFSIIEYAEHQLNEGNIQEAIDSTAWCHNIAIYYENNTYIRSKAKKLLKLVRRMMRLIDKHTK